MGSKEQMAQVLAQQSIGAPVDFGRPLVKNPDGSVSSEVTMTTQHPQGHWANVPTMMNGVKLPPDVIDPLYQHGLVPDVGTFPTLDEALQAARARTKAIRR
jgi:hypothetical protein